MAETEKDPRIIASLQRALDILALFGPQTPELGITDIAKSLNLHKSTASGLVYTLQRNGYLAQNPENRRYHLGLQLVERAGVCLIKWKSARSPCPSSSTCGIGLPKASIWRF